MAGFINPGFEERPSWRHGCPGIEKERGRVWRVVWAPQLYRLPKPREAAWGEAAVRNRCLFTPATTRLGSIDGPSKKPARIGAGREPRRASRPAGYFVLKTHIHTATRWLGRASAAVGLLFLLVSSTPLTTWWAGALADPWESPRGEVLIVLGADRVDDMLGYSSYWRSVYAVWAFRGGEFRRVVVSGGPGGAAVADSIQQFLIASGVPAEAITVETASASTRENALRTAELLRTESAQKVLLTSDFHMYRAYRCFQEAGVDVIAVPVPDALKRSTRWYRRWTAFVDLTEETAKIAYYWWRGWI